MHEGGGVQTDCPAWQGGRSQPSIIEKKGEVAFSLWAVIAFDGVLLAHGWFGFIICLSQNTSRGWWPASRGGVGGLLPIYSRAWEKLSHVLPMGIAWISSHLKKIVGSGIRMVDGQLCLVL